MKAAALHLKAEDNANSRSLVGQKTASLGMTTRVQKQKRDAALKSRRDAGATKGDGKRAGRI